MVLIRTAIQTAIRTAGRRLASERGSVGVVMALVIFVAMGMLTMTWNTAELSKAKMRLQNAADSAALAHAIWQARGMNAVQNINDEMYEALSLAVKLRTVAKWLETTAMVFEGLSHVPFVGGFFKAAAIGLHGFGVMFGGTGGWMAARICDKFLKYIQMVYVYASSLLGIWNAQVLAAQNEADPLASRSSATTTAESDGWYFGFYALPLSWPPKDAFLLPLEKSGKCNESPWKASKISVFDASTSPWKQMYSFAGAGEAWEIQPYVSKRGDKEGLTVTTKDGKKTVKDNGILPGPTMWVAFKLGKNIHTMPLDGFWNPGDSTNRWTHKLPMFAVSAAQCITGDVVPHSKKLDKNEPNQRPSGFGTGATAKLVPVGEVVGRMQSVVGRAVDAVIYH